MDVREIGKSKSQRIEIDYYRRSTWLTRSRGLLALIAAVLAAGYCFFVFASSGGSHLSTGPLANAHAAFENDCKQCHLDFTPISSDSLRFSSSDALGRIENACQECHRVEQHFRSMMTSEFATIDQHCSGCHTDHLGRDNNLVNISTGQCTKCHGDLPATCASPSSIQIKPSVTDFTAEGHGDFTFRGKGDPGSIKFDHWQHMLPGQVDLGAKGAFMISMLEPELREGYRKLKQDGTTQTDDDLVMLSCIDCHQFAGEPSTVGVGDKEIGRHMAPIVFEQHCAACHAMNTDGRVEGVLPLPHGAPWREIETLITAKNVGSQQSGTSRLPRDVVRIVPLVGEGNTGPLLSATTTPGDTEEEKAVRRAAANKAALRAAVSADLGEIRQRCLQCHESKDISDEAIEALRTGTQPPLIPERWLSRGIYDHAAHREMDCKFCHAEAFPPTDIPSDSLQPREPKDSEIVMIGGIETCVGCHRDAELVVPRSLTDVKAVELIGGQTNWSSNACTECHRYHWQRPATAAADSMVRAESVVP
jgi:hypothetical protein